MTAATLHIAAPTRLERTGLRLAAAITARVQARIVRRAERRLLALDMLREQQARRADPVLLQQALQAIGSRAR